MKFKTAYTKQERKQVCFKDTRSLTKTEQAQACDTNYILERFVRTGIIDHVQQHEPQYGEFENFDFHEMQNKVARATQLFEQLPAKTRHEHFGNDPAQFIEFIASEQNVRDMDDGVIGNNVQEPVKATENNETPPE